jgi:hypothetical protein
MAYYKENLKSSGDKASPRFRPFCIELLDKCLPLRTLLYISFKHIFISLPSYMCIPDSIRLFYDTSLLTESEAFLKSTNGWCTVSLYWKHVSLYVNTRLWSSGLWHRVVLYADTDVSMFRSIIWRPFPTLKMKAGCLSEISVSAYSTTGVATWETTVYIYIYIYMYCRECL